ncbi:hypothetical protein [Methylobacterium nodulans]|uniref:hypothetical protein n=1 Tax=Methylobacterium nodulans TaxID=114616 RepID=UPI0018DCB5D5|nr:hypothetical protein [Methylobacterium nodulans]
MLTLLTALLLTSVSIAQGQDAKSYCAKVGNDDRVKPLPATLVQDARRALDLRDMDNAWVRESTVYRCMSGYVWLCNHGANIPCTKADVRRTSEGATQFCRENPGSDIVPMAATGHGTIYSWKCVGKKPRIVSSETVDPRGFIANQWTRL